MTLHRRNPRRDANEPGIVEYLIRAGAVVNRISAPGVPDLLVGYRGTWLLLEVKQEGGRLKTSQELFHNACEALKLPCHVVYSPDDCRRILRRYADREERTMSRQMSKAVWEVAGVPLPKKPRA